MRYKSLKQLSEMEGEEFYAALEEHEIFWLESINADIAGVQKLIEKYQQDFSYLKSEGLTDEDMSELKEGYKSAQKLLSDLKADKAVRMKELLERRRK